MHAVSSLFALLPRILVPLLSGLLLAGVVLTAPKASEPHAFIIGPSAGYGLSECLAAGGDCGRVVADAWCEAHGHAAARAFGLAEDVTHSIATNAAASPAVEPGSLIISCAE